MKKAERKSELKNKLRSMSAEGLRLHLTLFLMQLYNCSCNYNRNLNIRYIGPIYRVQKDASWL